MAFCRATKRSIGSLISNGLLNNATRHGFSSCATNKTFVVEGVQYGSSVPYVHDANSAIYSRLSLLRRFSVETPPGSDQMSLIKQLRERTSAPIKDVKAALIDCNWDIEAAQTELRKRGKVLALKKSARTAAEGLLALAQNETKAVVIELNCETDFVARNEIFQYLALSLAKQALLSESLSHNDPGTFPVGPEQLEGIKLNLEHPKINGETTALNAVTEVAAIMGENIKLRRGFLMSASPSGVISTYLHTSPQPGLGRIAGILSIEVEGDNSQPDALQRVGSELAMHVVAAKPLFLTKELVASDALENEREILKSQAETTGKSQMAIEKMVEGRLRKYMEEVVLMEQKFIINDSINVKTMLDNLSKEVGSPVTIRNFLRVGVGEGIDRLETSDSPEPVAQAA
ncbi:elongation factor Ts [Cucumis melo var. makuwa]|uniref:Elongation factor Ts, mitochondrial n=2 Tax=Cucumis melo TaxID=3656 RepID=A0A1S3C4R6_CUCME|nr:elongation factor Ts, mitochondrial isoform X1 [Cucumis melo]KAA0047361.1 elongation factor Ts [Cucumis melo var. makuwa]TYK14038.1 elongation factor Ts [Cucumis melo var. makuwa]